MHTLIITPRLLHSSLLKNALERQNIKSLVCSPNSLAQDWSPSTDAVIFPNPLESKDWQLLVPFLLNLSPKLPLIFLNKIDEFLFKENALNTLTRQSLTLDGSLNIDEIPLLVKDIIQKKPSQTLEKLLTHGDIALDRSKRVVMREGKQNILTKKEFFLLELLLKNPEQIITRDLIMDYLWDKNTYVEANTVDVTVSRLRKKLWTQRRDGLIRTIPCLGYQLCAGKN